MTDSDRAGEVHAELVIVKEFTQWSVVRVTSRLRRSQIVAEEFLEDINNMLNSGEVPNLFEKDELEQVLAATRPHAKEAGVAEGNRDEVQTM